MKSAADARAILDRLEAQHPGATTELRFDGPYQLIVATILSAQCTDARVNKVTPALFERYSDAAALAHAEPDEIAPLIQSTGFFRAKSRALSGMARALVERHEGVVPRERARLVRLPGVGRKTANVVCGHAFGLPALAVDRHVLRVSNRLGIARSDDPDKVERQLCRRLPSERWTHASDTLILHGRRICKARPLCDRCSVRNVCVFFRTRKGATKPGPEPSAPSRTPRPR